MLSEMHVCLCQWFFEIQQWLTSTWQELIFNPRQTGLSVQDIWYYNKRKLRHVYVVHVTRYG